MKPEIFKLQSYRLKLNSRINLLANTVIKIFYVKPDGVKGFWTGILDVDQTTVYYDVPSAVNNLEGNWKYQIYVEIGGKKYYGSIVENKIMSSIE